MIAALALVAVTHVPQEHYHRLAGPPRRSVMIEYTVQRGDTLWDIAEQYSGGGENWRWILRGRDMERPNPRRLHAGEILAVPELSS